MAGPLTLNATVYWTLNATGTAVAPYPTVVCAATGTFVPPCHGAAAAGLCLNVGALPNRTESRPVQPLSRLGLYSARS